MSPKVSVSSLSTSFTIQPIEVGLDPAVYSPSGPPTRQVFLRVGLRRLFIGEIGVEVPDRHKGLYCCCQPTVFVVETRQDLPFLSTDRQFPIPRERIPSPPTCFLYILCTTFRFNTNKVLWCTKFSFSLSSCWSS